MKEQIITLETAKLAKEKNFREEVPTLYIGESLHNIHEERDEQLFPDDWNGPKMAYDKEGYSCFGCKKDNVKWFEAFSAPTQSFLQKFIREKRGVHIEIHRNASGYYWSMCLEKGGTDLGWSDISGPNMGGVWDTFEDALENALQVQLGYDLPKMSDIGHWGNYAEAAIEELKIRGGEKES